MCLTLSVSADEKQLLEQAQDFADFYSKRLTKDEVTEQVSELKEQFHREQLRIDEETAKMLRSLRNPFLPQLPEEVPQEKPAEEEGPASSTDKKTPNPAQTTPGQNTNKESPPVAEEPVVKPSYKISGIVWNTDRPQAIIEGRVVDIGDKIEEWDITAISRNGVEVSYKNHSFLIEP